MVLWTERNGKYRWPSGVQPDSKYIYDGKEPKAELRFAELNAGNVPRDSPSPCHLLPVALIEWLERLGVMGRIGGDLVLSYKSSITCVVHQPCRENAFDASQRLWYCNIDDCPGEAAVLFIPLKSGEMTFDIPADYSSGSRVRSFCNGFVKRTFPFNYGEAPEWFRTQISGAENNEPFVFASLIYCPKQSKVHLAIEIIPPSDMPLNNIQDFEDLMKQFTDGKHNCWEEGWIDT
jgi:hypothetical protein